MSTPHALPPELPPELPHKPLARTPLVLSVAQCVDHIVREFGNDIRIGMPLGLGKPVPLINALYQRAKKDASIQLTVFAALSLEKPSSTHPLERRFIDPFVERVWAGVPEIELLKDLRLGEVPLNVHLHEFAFKADTCNHCEPMRQAHICSNHTQVVRDCAINGHAIFAQMLSKSATPRERCYSASCNADTTLQTLKEFAAQKARGHKRMCIGMVNPALPFMYGDAELPPEAYDVIIDDAESHFALFSTPRLAVSDVDYMIGLHASALIKDGGTLQIGIGALGDAIAHGLDLRHNQNAVYTELLDDGGTLARHGALIQQTGGTQPFVQGLYGATEMLVDAFMQLYKRGVVKRKVYHHVGLQRLANEGRLRHAIPPQLLEWMLADETLPPYLTRKEFLALQHHGVFKDSVAYEGHMLVDGSQRYSPLLIDADNLRRISTDCLGTELRHGVLLTGGLFIGPRDFYETLRHMPEDERRQFEMTGVEVTNQLYGGEELRALQRRDGRFCNTGTMATLLGGIVSDGMEDGTVISGVGGQYNLVAMAHALPDARLVMMVKSTRHEPGATRSNILFNHDQVTIPRQLRDIVVTEYGIADLRGRSDAEVIQAMLNVADSRFQGELLAEAKRHKKLPAGYEIPEAHLDNTPERLAGLLQGFKARGCFAPYPFGTEFTHTEMILAQAMTELKARSTAEPAAEHAGEMAAALQALPAEPPQQAMPFLERMGLQAPASVGEVQMQKTVMLALRLIGVI